LHRYIEQMFRATGILLTGPLTRLLLSRCSLFRPAGSYYRYCILNEFSLSARGERTTRGRRLRIVLTIIATGDNDNRTFGMPVP
jgi:hypothetical protein